MTLSYIIALFSRSIFFIKSVLWPYKVNTHQYILTCLMMVGMEGNRIMLLWDP